MIADALTKHLGYVDFKRHMARLVHQVQSFDRAQLTHVEQASA